MKRSTSWILTIGAAILTGFILVGIFAALLILQRGFFPFWLRSGPQGLEGYGFERRTYASNGERIYYTGVNDQGQRIPFEGGPMWLYMRGGGCVDCHGINGKGGVPVMMGIEVPPPITYHALTEEEHEEHEGEGEEHPPYTDETIKRAITESLDPAGEPLDYTMPRWQMSGKDLDDLLEFLKTLE